MKKMNIPEEKFWNVAKTGTKTGEVYIYHQISNYHYEGYSDSAESIKKDIEELGDVDTINIYINSPGGSVTEGIAIYNYLRRKSKTAKIVGYIDGIAASIATIIASACDELHICTGGMYMIHRASTYAWGNVDEMKEQLEILDKIDSQMTDIYLSRTNGKITEEKLKEMLKGTNNDGTWLTAKEAVEYGFCDDIEDFESKATALWDDKSFESEEIPDSALKFAKHMPSIDAVTEDERKYLEKQKLFMKMEGIQ